MMRLPKGAKIECIECHHLYKDGKNTWKEGDKVQKCAECHEMKPAKTGKGLAAKLQTAMHTNCQDCHKGIRWFGVPADLELAADVIHDDAGGAFLRSWREALDI